jgi:heat shock protein HtpX
MIKNTAKTAALLAFLGAIFLGIGSLFGQGGLVIGLVLGLVFVGGSYWFSDKLAVMSARAVPVTEQEAPRLYAIVRDLAQRANMPMPRIYISPADQPNAFATGPKKAVVAVTRGLLQVLDEDELRGVLAHEMAHVRHRDILITSVAAAVAMAITFLARMVMWGAMFGGAGDDDDGGGIFGALAMMILAPIAAVLIQAALSRSREFEADRGGAELLGNPEPLARALQKIEAYAKQVPMKIDPAQATAYIINPLTGRKVQFANWFSTHPPTEERIERLREYRYVS